MREPEKYAFKKEGGVYDDKKANPNCFNDDGTIKPFKTPIMEIFSKHALIVKEDNNIDMLSETAAKTNPRYFKDGKPTEYMHEDPILITPADNEDLWYVYNQKKPISDKPLAVIYREKMELRTANGDFIRNMNETECFSKSNELILKQTALGIANAINYACQNTIFSKFEFDADGNVVMGEEIGPASIIDIKLEFGITADGLFLLTDDVQGTNMRLAFNNNPQISLKGLYSGYKDAPVKLQNFKDVPQMILTSAIFADGTKNFANINYK